MPRSSSSGPLPWIRAARPGFFPIALLMYASGVFAGARHAGALDWLPALLGYLCVLLAQAAAGFTNEHFDHSGDAHNQNASRFTGGSRVLVDKLLTHEDLLKASAASVVALGAASALLLATTPHTLRVPLTIATALGIALALAYTAPPLKLGSRGFGELTVAFTHTTLVLLFGWTIQGGSPTAQVPFLVAMPAFWALLALRTLAGIPDVPADRATGRRTYAVIFGPAQAAGIAAFAALAAGTAGILLWRDGILRGLPGVLAVAAAAHGVVLAVMLARYIRSGAGVRRIGQLLGVATAFVLWYGLIPLLRFLGASFG
ncbi:MAG TPA: prenyltransferase [Candidatus Krumholzibacteria bacterium]|nr:prenyltransferase [Candidatus Krumholzibacteria bacterium]